MTRRSIVWLMRLFWVQEIVGSSPSVLIISRHLKIPYDILKGYIAAEQLNWQSIGFISHWLTVQVRLLLGIFFLPITYSIIVNGGHTVIFIFESRTSPNGKATVFDIVICGFESRCPRRMGTQYFIGQKYQLFVIIQSMYHKGVRPSASLRKRIFFILEFRCFITKLYLCCLVNIGVQTTNTSTLRGN